LVLWALPTVGLGCGNKGESSASPPSSASVPGGGPSAAIAPPAVSTSKPQNLGPLVGTWRGSFESKKATVELDPGVKETSWSKDDGKAKAGKTEIDLSVTADGVAKGSLRGALGEATLAGAVDGETLTLTFTPKDDSTDAISGVIVLRLRGPKLGGELKGASGDAALVRAASLELDRAEAPR